jgi:antitoxin component YwqK of YwqJK toxin-antitoxin module
VLNLGYRILFVLLLSIAQSVFAQTDSIYQVFKDDSGNVLSEGYLLNGQPVGYWITYYPNNSIKSEGNRKNGLLDGPWKFYNKEGQLVEIINYREGKKNGLQYTFNKDSVIVRRINFFNNLEQDTAYYYYPDGTIKEWLVFNQGKQSGKQILFAEDGRPVEIRLFKEGKQLERSSFNQYNSANLKSGVWKEFSKDWILLYEVDYKNGLKHGYERLYDEYGKLKEIRKYLNGKLIKEAEETQALDVKTNYGDNNQLEVGGYNVKGQKEGVHQTYDASGKPISSKIYDDDRILAEGIISSSGQRNGYWKLYYSDGTLKAEGEYKNNKKIGKWLYYYSDDELQHIAYYSMQGKAENRWIWFFENGDTLAILNYLDGVLEGDYLQFDEKGNKVVQGLYSDDMKQGNWKYIVGTQITIGSYLDDNREGEWITRDTVTNKVVFKGSYQADLATGFHRYNYVNGVPKKFGDYQSGVKVGTWQFFKPSGEIIQSITYEQGIEVRLDDYKIEPRNIFKSDIDY